ncbi:sensor histidine kinase [Sinosporangium siamense]|uniref:sensor histidine kinase n=1 Tax=Sinosporangium siamense TaxID=1367973 RepID=UPI001951440D|nr:sensor histidine kinase [Sinosporangium siamense]
MRTSPRGVIRPWPGGPPAVDVVLAVLLTAVTITLNLLSAEHRLLWESGVWVGEGFKAPTGWALVLIAFTCLPIAWRRRAPVVAVLLSEASSLLMIVAGQASIGTAVAAMILLYSAAAYRGLAVNVWVLAVVVSSTAAGWWLADPVPSWSERVLALLLLGVVWGAGRGVRLRRAYTAELRDRAERLERARESDTRAARAEERSRIARELHDVVAHHVSVMTVQAAAARRVLGSNPDGAREALSAIEETGRTAMREMRNLVGVLRTDEVDGPAERGPQPGLRDLPALFEQMREAGLRAQLWIEGEPGQVPAGVDLAAYRLVQEGLTNSLRHAGPGARAWVTVRHGDGELAVVVEDDGAGPPEASEGRRPGHGLVGIRERVALYGGILRIGPRSGGGFEVTARFPLKDGS